MDKNKFKKRAALDYLLAKIFDFSPSEFEQYLFRQEQQKQESDPFVEAVVEKPKEPEIKPLKFLSSPSGDRFKALREKIAAVEAAHTEGADDAT